MRKSKKPDWKIFYSNGETFSSLEGEPWEAPANGVLVIVQGDPEATRGAYLVWMADYYLWKFGRWFPVDTAELMFYWFIHIFPHPKAALRGEMVENKTWKRVTEEAKNDMEMWS